MDTLLLRGGLVIDGCGSPAFGADILVEDGRIAAVGERSTRAAQRVIDVDCRVVAPGFIDLHTHSDFSLPVYPRAESMTRQGVTTQVVGNCGFSPFPVVAGREDLLRSFSAFFGDGLAWDWADAEGFATMLDALPLAGNVALQVGHGSVRIAAMGFDRRDPTPAELDHMRRSVAAAFDAGAFGFSSGLIYPPGSYAGTAELVALAQVAGRCGGFYSTHVRGEADTLLEAVDEALVVGARAGIPVHLSHHKAAGKRNWGAVHASLLRLDTARGAGSDVTADQYPYTASSTTLAVALPPWAVERGVAELVWSLEDPDTRSRIRKEILEPPADALLNSVRPLDPGTVTIASTPDGPWRRCEGRTLAQIATERKTHAVDVVLDLVAGTHAQVQMVVESMSEADVRHVMRHPEVAVASDGWTLSPEAGGRPHPRSYGTFARVLGHYVRDEGVLGLEEAVRKMTSLPARRLGRPDLGRIEVGCRADLVVFDPETVRERATFDEPHRFCAGVGLVMVAGVPVIEGPVDTGATPGRVLRRVRA